MQPPAGRVLANNFVNEWRLDHNPPADNLDPKDRRKLWRQQEIARKEWIRMMRIQEAMRNSAARKARLEYKKYSGYYDLRRSNPVAADVFQWGVRQSLSNAAW